MPRFCWKGATAHEFLFVSSSVRINFFGYSAQEGVLFLLDFFAYSSMSKHQALLPRARLLWNKLGPGLITGAADDDPSGIATYSQAGAGFGYSMLWTAFFTFPLMVGIQMISARIGRVTGQGLAANIRQHHSRRLLYFFVGLLLVANTINIDADIGAMAAALKLLIGGPALWYAIDFAVV